MERRRPARARRGAAEGPGRRRTVPPPAGSGGHRALPTAAGGNVCPAGAPPFEAIPDPAPSGRAIRNRGGPRRGGGHRVPERARPSPARPRPHRLAPARPRSSGSARPWSDHRSGPARPASTHASPIPSPLFRPAASSRRVPARPLPAPIGIPGGGARRVSPPRARARRRRRPLRQGCPCRHPAFPAPCLPSRSRSAPIGNRSRRHVPAPSASILRTSPVSSGRPRRHCRMASRTTEGSQPQALPSPSGSRPSRSRSGPPASRKAS